LREYRRGRHEVKKLDTIIRRISRYGISAIHRSGKLAPVTYIRVYDRRSGASTYYITPKEFAHNVAIIFISAGAFGLGIGQCISELLKR
jgi:hypothetical protein